MTVIGVKSSTQILRYAVIEFDQKTRAVDWLNRESENRILFPKEDKDRIARVEYIYEEFTRIFRQANPDLVLLKLPEGRKGAYQAWALDVASYETAIILAARRHHSPVEERKFKALKLNSNSVEQFVLQHVTQSSKHWDTHIVDALAAALKEVGK